MGISSSNNKVAEPTNVNININIKGLQKSINSEKNGSTKLEDSNCFNILGGDLPAPGMPNIQEQNSYSNKTFNINVQAKNGNISIPLNQLINNNLTSPNQNNDNNIKDPYLKKKNENNNNYKKDINPNYKIDENLYQDKETSKGSKYKKEINPFMGNYFNGKEKEEEEGFTKPSNDDNNIGNNFNPENYKYFTKTGNNDDNNIEREKDNYNSPDENKDNNKIRDNISHPLDGDNDNKEENKNDALTKSVLLASFQNLNFMDPNDMLIIKKQATKKYEEGYFPLFVKMDHTITYYYLKQENTLQNLLLAHLNSLKIPYKGENYSFYNKGIKLNPNIPVIDIDSLGILSVLEIKKIE